MEEKLVKVAFLNLLVVFLGMGCVTSTTERLHLSELQTVVKVNLSQYLGTWYDIASFLQRFQLGCTGTTATYSLKNEMDILVTNRCYKGSLDGPEEVAVGQARVIDTITNAKLKVSFFRPFWGEYWIIDLGSNYDYAVVGHPSRDYLWILSRTPAMDEKLYKDIVERLKKQGYEITKLVRTPQRLTKS